MINCGKSVTNKGKSHLCVATPRTARKMSAPAIFCFGAHSSAGYKCFELKAGEVVPSGPKRSAYVITASIEGNRAEVACGGT
jgi:hypothetical protein